MAASSIEINVLVRREQNAAKAGPSVGLARSVLFLKLAHVRQNAIDLLPGRWTIQDAQIKRADSAGWIRGSLVRDLLRHCGRPLSDKFAVHHEQRLRGDRG